MRRACLTAIATLAALGAASVAIAAVEQDDERTFSINWEDDIWNGTDANYTNGIRFSVAGRQDDVPDWLEDTADVMPFFDARGSKRWQFAFGQNMYTPKNYELTTPQPNDRPYAGWLYGSAGLTSDTGRTLDNFNITLGIVGPSSLAEQVQETVHDAIGSPHPMGWQYQLHDEPGVIVSYERKWRNLWQVNPGGYGFDVTPSAGGAVGNILTQASVGSVVRFGKNLPTDYGPPLINSVLTGTDYFVANKNDDLGWYIFAGVQGDAVARNIFLDGNTFRDSARVNKEDFVGDLQGGVAVTYHGVRYAYTEVVRSKEFKTQDDGDSYGALTVSWKF